MKEGSSTIATILPVSNSGLEFPVVAQPTPKEELDGKLDKTQEHLLLLRRQQQELERQKGELEELRRKQDEYTRGRAEMLDNLTRGLITLEREQIEAQRLAELCDKTMGAFRGYKERIEAIQDGEWTSETVRGELSKSLAVIQDSRLEFNRARTKLDCLNPGANQPAPLAEPVDQPFVQQRELLRFAALGAAASAPLIIAGTIWLIILVAAR